ncbi:hypothetical protein P7C73_g5195, partial [Tremellales sp. Uapishka_1]
MPPLPRYPPGVQQSSSSGSIPGRGPLATRAKAGVKLNAGSDATRAAPAVEIEEYGPPGWRTVLNERADLGYPDFYPSRPGNNQPEDVLTEENVKNGFSGKAPIAITAESFSMHGPIYKQLMQGGLAELNELGKEVAEKRNESMPPLGERSFRIPVRVTYNDTKRSQFLSELSNPTIPLHRLMRNPVPHGFKGLELLDTMFAPPSASLGAGHNRTPSGGPKPAPEPIPVERAVWFIRVLGVNEITAHRGRAQPAPTPVQAPSPAAATPSSTATVTNTAAPALLSNDWYTLDFTMTFTSWLQIQLGQLVLPTQAKGVAKPTVPGPKVVGALGDEKTRARWSAKWSYSMTLLRKLHTRRLLSSRILCGWLADSLATSNLAQVGFMAQLITSYLPDMAHHLSIGRHSIRACCDKIIEIRAGLNVASLGRVQDLLINIITSLFDATPEVLLSPITWKSHTDLLTTVIFAHLERQKSSLEAAGATFSSADHRGTKAFKQIKKRNEAMIFRATTAESNSSPRRQQMDEVNKLDSICGDTDMSKLCKSYFSGSTAPESSSLDITKLEEKIFILLNWSMGLFYLGGHRPYAVHTLLLMWVELHDEHRAKLPKPTKMDMFPILYNWLDSSKTAQQNKNILAIGITFGELTRQGMFSYGRYLQTIIARGYTVRCRAEGGTESHHLSLLRAMPIFVEAKDLLRQRRLALCGDSLVAQRLDEEQEQAMLQSYKEEVEEYLPEIFGWKLRDALDHHLIWPPQLNRYLFLQARFWTFPTAAASLVRQGKSPAMDASTFARMLHLYRSSVAFSTITDLLLKGLKMSSDMEVLSVIVDAIKRHEDVWTSIDAWGRLANALMDRFQRLRRREKWHHGLSELLLAMADNGRLDAEATKKVRGAKAKRILQEASQTAGGHAAPSESLTVLRAGFMKGDTTAVCALAPKMFIRHGPFSNWSSPWWQTIIEVVESASPNGSTPLLVLGSVVAHVEKVVNYLGDLLDPVVASWLAGHAASARIELLGRKTSFALSNLVLTLAVRRLLSAATILESMVYPDWKHASSITLSARRLPRNSMNALENTVVIAQQLLLTKEHKHLPPTTLRESLVLQTTRQKVFSGVKMETLIQHLPYLVVLGTTKTFSEKLKAQISNLLDSLAKTQEFKTAAFRHLDLLKDAFLSSEWSKKSSDPALEAGMVETLKLIMSDGSSGTLFGASPVGQVADDAGSSSDTALPSLNSMSRFSAWRWTRIVLEMRVEFKRLAMRIQTGDAPEEARQALVLLVRASIDRESTADDTDLLCEAFRGIEPVVTQEILAAGLERLAMLLAQLMGAEQLHDAETAIQSIDLSLRILDSTSRNMDKSQNETAVAARDRLLDLLAVALQSVQRQILAESDVHALVVDGDGDFEVPSPGALLKVVEKILRFTLGLPGSEGQVSVAKPQFSNLAVSFFKVIVAIVSTPEFGMPVDYLSDILAFIVDAAPPQYRTAVHTALLWESSLHTPPALPSLRQALPYASPARRPMVLGGSQAPDESSFEACTPLDDRPWEMFEQMTPNPPLSGHRDQFLASRPFKDTSSIPMYLFGPQMKRDHVPDTSDEGQVEDEMSWRDFAAERSLGNGLAGEALSARQLATMLYASEPDAPSPATSVSAVSAMAPAAPVRPRRASTRLIARPQPSGSTQDPIEIDDDGNEDDSDLEVVEGPPASKRPRTGGKAVPRTTTGGKSVARKNTGGKSTRGGKSIKGRRKSGQD